LLSGSDFESLRLDRAGGEVFNVSERKEAETSEKRTRLGKAVLDSEKDVTFRARKRNGILRKSNIQLIIYHPRIFRLMKVPTADFRTAEGLIIRGRIFSEGGRSAPRRAPAAAAAAAAAA